MAQGEYVVMVDTWGNDSRFIKGAAFGKADIDKLEGKYDLDFALMTNSVMKRSDAEDRGIRPHEMGELPNPIPVQERVDHDLTPTAEEILAAGGDAELALVKKREQFDEQAEVDLKAAKESNEAGEGNPPAAAQTRGDIPNVAESGSLKKKDS